MCAALDAGLLDELTVTIVRVILGSAIPLGAGAHHRHALVLERHEALAGGDDEVDLPPLVVAARLIAEVVSSSC